MKILWFTEFYPKDNDGKFVGGVQTRCYFVGRHISKNQNLQIIEGVPEKFTKASFLTLFIRALYLPLEVYKGLNSDFDIVEASNFVMYLPAWIVGRLKNKPVVFWYADVFLGSWVKNVGPVGIIGERAEKWILGLKGVHYIAISNVVKDKLIKAGVPKDKITVIYCGVSSEEIKLVKKGPKVRDLISVSRLTSYKKIDTLITAVDKLKVKLNQIQLGIVGWGAEEKKLKDQARNLHLEENVTFFGQIPSHKEVLEKISESKVFCHPSLVEGFGISIIEALALGVPAVIAKTPIAEEITNGGQGVLFFDSQQGLESKITNLLTDAKLYTSKRNEGLTLAKNYFWEDISKETLKFYENLHNN